MAPSAVDLPPITVEQASVSMHNLPPAKRRRVSLPPDGIENTRQYDKHLQKAGASSAAGADGHNDSHTSNQGSSFVHPLGIRPAGNAWGSSTDLRRSCGSFGRLPDDLLMQVLEALEPLDLVKIGSTCKAFYAFCSADELWRPLFTQLSPEHFTWRGTWRNTLLEFPPLYAPSVDCTGLFSDALYRPYFCSKVSLDSFVQNIPARNSIARLDDLDEAAFNDEWADKPFILSSPVKAWPVFKSWDVPSLLERYKDTVFRAEAVDWPLQEYISYMENSEEESPLYLFDRAFAEKMNITVGSGPSTPPDASYWPPQCFGEDFFTVLGDQRPDCRWMILGPERSGSTFHKDPNATSAWNAVLRGSKYWIMFPSSETIPPPPGVFVSEDQSEVTSPLSIAEWLLGYHGQARRTPGCKEGICGEGEVLHVPSGWFHLVLNLEPSLALTQNFIPRAHLTAALDFLKNKPDQVTGFSKDVEDPYGMFCARMRELHPELLDVALKELDKKNEATKRKWDVITAADNDETAGGFSFGFADDDDDDDE